ncbi:TetR/AcrR family transcriptional regulator [Pontibacter sp. G13]|uniref:TetR/AcrR family transcriptional regulator n=1 Tax=Pontibacter sp. G13 TaxID=3074898 RepID=UPI002889D343|nr:TetR/AcrR family transcriptional regulator [Pontibacter sp. G13]WNJ20391.1 TetR/AcrR family transcriptional regulator [Pontibacter sp. G13]
METIELKTLSPRKKQILESAQALFSQKGYVAASMRDLAEVLKIKPASLYSHYTSKEEMLWEIAVRCAAEFHEVVLPLAQGTDAPDLRLQRMIEAHIDVMMRNMDASAIFFEEWKRLEEPRLGTYTTLIQQYEQAFIGVIREGIEGGIFRTVKPRFVTSMLLSSMNWIHQWYKPTGTMTQTDIQTQCVAFIMGGLRAESPQERA